MLKLVAFYKKIEINSKDLNTQNFLKKNNRA